MDEFKILRDLVGFNTINDKENVKIINYIEKFLKNYGFKTEYKTKCLIMSIGKNQKLGFLGHTDTVEYIEEFKNPFDLTIKNDLLYGLGVCDMKGSIAAILDVVSKIDFKKLKSGMKLYFTFDEEIGFEGIKELVDKKEKFPELMIFGEPTDNKMYTGHKGLLEYKIEFKGIKCHSSNPEKGISANLNAVNFIYELQKFYNKKIKTYNNSLYEIPYTTMNVGIIKGGSAINSIPAYNEVYIDFRVANKNHIEKIQKKIEELAIKYNAKVNILNLIKSFIDKVSVVGEPKTLNFMTEAAFIDNSKRIILGLGPVTAHEVNEHISIDSYKTLVKQYEDLIYKVLT